MKIGDIILSTNHEIITDLNARNKFSVILRYDKYGEKIVVKTFGLKQERYFSIKNEGITWSVVKNLNKTKLFKIIGVLDE